ncbi:MAG: FkbM family methyltransferase [Methanomicrobiales archaeon]|nr:FkbM family methyltransferase [Methanomicrobiales archaeon]MDI6876125.1 FkbM family methyltransferase [Methanomicrobiales archaeon]
MVRAFPDRQRGDAVLVAPDGVKFVRGGDPGDSVYTIEDYRADDIRPDDVVLDIGANAGAFCIRAARRARHVFAVEPVTADLLRSNIALNGVRVPVLEGALGDGGVREISWGGRTVSARTYPLRELRSLAGGCDFLKCDCEGGEWSIVPAELAGIRRIEMELHVPPISGPVNPALLEYISRHYAFEIEWLHQRGPLGVLGVLHAVLRA